MIAIRTGKSTNTYKRKTPAQLASTIRQLQRQFITVRNKPTWQKIGGKTVVQQCRAIAGEIKKVATVLRNKTVQQINVKIRTLRTQFAKRIGVKFSSPKTTTPAVKRLKNKLLQISKCRRVSTLINMCTGVKLSTYKNPTVRGKVHKAKRTRSARSARRTRRTTARRHPATAHVRKYRRQATTLKKVVNRLKRRNNFMSRLVNQFRRKVAKLKRSYRSGNAKPRWKVIHGRPSTSNVVRFHRPTWNRQAQRRVG